MEAIISAKSLAAVDSWPRPLSGTLTAPGNPPPRLMPGSAFHDPYCMQFNSNLGLSRLTGPRDGRRAPGRVTQEQLASSLGPVLDLSTGGMRVLATRPPPPEETLVVRLLSGTVCLDLACRVAWTRRLGFRRHEVGLSFSDLDGDVVRMLSRISLDHRARLAV